MTTGYDKCVKLWDIKAKDTSYQIKLEHPIEDFTRINEHEYAVANGYLVSLIDIRMDSEPIRTINAHQKTVLKVKYDEVKQRLITGGSD